VSCQPPTERIGPCVGVSGGLLCFFHQAVADAWLGEYQAGLGGFDFQLLAEMGDVNAEVVGLVQGVWPPHFLEDVAMGQDLAGVLDEEAKQGVFRGGQPDLAVVELDQARGQVNFEAAGAKVAGLGARLGVALGNAKAREEFGRAEGFVT